MRLYLLLICAAALAAADLGGIDGLILPLSPPRPGMPLLVELRLTSRLGAREGQAVIVLKTDAGEDARWEGPVWRVGPEGTTFRVLLPPARGWEGFDDLRAEVAWREDGLSLPLLTQILARSGNLARAVAELAPPGLDLPRALVQSPPPSDEGQTPARVGVVRLDPLDAASSAEAWLAWDAVLLHPATALPEPVREALTRWLLAGGSIVLTSGNPGPEVAALLAAAEASGCGSQSGPGWTRLRAGLGQVLRPTGGEAAAAAAAESFAAALWGGRASAPSRRYDGSSRPESDLSLLLWPEAVGRVPLTLVLVVFAGFLLWVGPVEWFVLGRLRRRRWTWITFPLAALAATYAVTAIARGAFGSADHVRRLVVVDCDAQGAARRCSIIEQRFAGGDRSLVEHPQGELILPLETGRQLYRGDGPVVELRAVHRGSWVSGGSVEIALPQWTPVLLRRLSLGLPAGVPRADFGPAPDVKVPDLKGLLHDGWTYAALSGDGGEVGDVYVMATSRRTDASFGANGAWTRLRRALAADIRGALADLARPQPCRLVARRQGADLIIWRQALKDGDP